MNRPPRILDAVECTRATANARMFLSQLLRKAENAAGDKEQRFREGAYWCKGCWYVRRGGIAGVAITMQPCATCLQVQSYGSTNTDVLCKPCAMKEKLCKHCGGDFEMSATRRKWPGNGTS